MPWRWRLCVDRWWKLNMITCGEGGAAMRYMGPMGQGCGKTKNIRRGCGEFSRFLRFEVGDGSEIRFGHNVWCGD
jgi:hypothetical protein